VKPQPRLPREVVDAPSLGTSPVGLDGALSALTQLEMSLPMPVGGTGCPPKVPPHPNLSRILPSLHFPLPETAQARGTRPCRHLPRRPARRPRQGPPALGRLRLLPRQLPLAGDPGQAGDLLSPRDPRRSGAARPPRLPAGHAQLPAALAGRQHLQPRCVRAGWAWGGGGATFGLHRIPAWWGLAGTSGGHLVQPSC